MWNKIYSLHLAAPYLCFCFTILCWLISWRVERRISKVTLARVLELSGITGKEYGAADRSVIVLGTLGALQALRLAGSRLTLHLSLYFQVVLIAITIYIWYKINDAGLVVSSNLLVSSLIPDYFSYALVALTLFIFLLSFGLLGKETHRNLPFWCGLLFLLEGFLLLAFLVDNLLIFYISFEGTLLPMYLLIGAWGSRSRKIKANYYFFLYTLVGSLFTLIGIILIYTFYGSFSYKSLLFLSNNQLLAHNLECLIWLLLSIGFFTKFPLFFFHLWLPEAHVEAPTVGSVILAAILLKLGVYGFIRLPFTLFSSGTVFWLPAVLPIAVMGAIYTAMVAIVQDDFKKIIAYSSISHMSFVLVGLLTGTRDGIVGSMFLTIGHGLTSGGLFVFAGLLYDRYKTRDIKYFGGLMNSMPYASFSFLFLILGNVGFPFLCNFPGELLILAGSVQRFELFSLIFSFSFILTAIYSFRLINIFFFGARKLQFSSNAYDLTRNEFIVLSSFNIAILLLGLFSAPLLNAFEWSIGMVI